jgi:hypothetical protein
LDQQTATETEEAEQLRLGAMEMLQFAIENREATIEQIGAEQRAAAEAAMDMGEAAWQAMTAAMEQMGAFRRAWEDVIEKTEPEQIEKITAWQAAGRRAWDAVTERTTKEPTAQELLVKFRDVLRQAWQNPSDTIALGVLRNLAIGHTKWQSVAGRLEIVVEDMLARVCVLFLRDHAAGRLAVCANPKCKSKFFVRSRKTQKFCEVPECLVVGHRTSTQNWWETKGRLKRAKKGKKK